MSARLQAATLFPYFLAAGARRGRVTTEAEPRTASRAGGRTYVTHCGKDGGSAATVCGAAVITVTPRVKVSFQEKIRAI